MKKRTLFSVAEQVSRGMEELLKDHAFELFSLGLHDEFYTRFRTDHGTHSYYFSVRFLQNRSSEIQIESGIVLVHDAITDVIRRTNGHLAESYHGALAIATRLGLYLNENNADGFFNSNNCSNIEVEDSEVGVSLAISTLYYTHFLGGVLRFMEETSTLQKLDDLINVYTLENPDKPIRPRVHFGSNRPWQILTGIIVAKLVTNPNYHILRMRYLDFAKSFEPGEVQSIDEFHRVIAYFDRGK